MKVTIKGGIIGCANVCEKKKPVCFFKYHIWGLFTVMVMDYEAWEKSLITTKKIISYMTYMEDWVRIIGTLGQINFSTFKSSPIDLMTGKKTVSFEYKRSAHI